MKKSSTDYILGREFSPHKEAIVTFDKDWNFVHVSKEAERFFRVIKSSDAIGKNLWELFPQLQGSLLEKNYKKVKKTNTPLGFEFYASQSKIWYQMHVYPNDGGIILYFRDITEHKKVERALKKSEERFRGVTENAPVGIYHVDVQGNCLFVNQRCAEITGLSLEELQNISWLKLLKEEKKGGIFKHWQEAAKKNKEYQTEYFMLRSPEPSKWFLGVTIGLYDDNTKEITGYLTTFSDISDAKKNQEELQTYKERLEQAQIAGEIGIFDWDMLNDTVYWSPQQEQLFGMLPHSFSGKFEDWQRMVHPEDILRVEKQTQLALKEKRTNNADEFRVIYPDNSVRWISVRAKIYYNPKGRPVRMIGVNMDITEQRQTEEYRQFFSEASKILSSSLDYQLTLNSVAQLAVPIFGDWCAVDLIENGKAQLVAIAHKDKNKIKWAKELREKYPPDLSNTSQGMAKVIATGKSEIYPVITQEMLDKSAANDELRKILKELNFRSIMIVPLKRKGKNIGTITFVSDTEQRRYNDTDLEMAEELAERSSVAIENAKLFASEQKAVQSRDEFLSIASHELKTPITVIKGFSQILQKRFKGNGDTLTLNLLERIEVQVERLTKLINELLDVTKIEAGKMSFSYEACNLTQIVQEVVADFRLMRTSHIIHIQGKSENTVLCDQERIRQVLNNLLSNAIKYSQENNTVIVLLEDTADSVIVRVKDYGMGIEKEHIPKIFQRFFRANAIEGTLSSLGLGLYISSEIITRHKGKIWVESEKDKGSTFSFSLPIFE